MPGPGGEKRQELGGLHVDGCAAGSQPMSPPTVHGPGAAEAGGQTFCPPRPSDASRLFTQPKPRHTQCERFLHWDSHVKPQYLEFRVVGVSPLILRAYESAGDGSVTNSFALPHWHPASPALSPALAPDVRVQPFPTQAIGTPCCAHQRANMEHWA